MAALEPVRKVKTSLEKQSAPALKEVEFTFRAPEARKVCIAGTFNAWDTKSMPLKKEKDGTWKIMMKLAPGKYEYKFVVDGMWAQNVPGVEQVANPYGSSNCVIGVS